MGFQPSSELSLTDGCWAEVDRRAFQTTGAATCKLHRGSISMEFWPARDVGHQNADVLKIRWSGPEPRTQSKAVSAKCYLQLYSLRHRQPVKDRSDAERSVRFWDCGCQYQFFLFFHHWDVGCFRHSILTEKLVDMYWTGRPLDDGHCGRRFELYKTRPEVEPATFRLQVRRPNHYAVGHTLKENYSQKHM